VDSEIIDLRAITKKKKLTQACQAGKKYPRWWLADILKNIKCDNSATV